MVEELTLRHEADVAAGVVGGVAAEDEVQVAEVAEREARAARGGHVLAAGDLETQAERLEPGPRHEHDRRVREIADEGNVAYCWRGVGSATDAAAAWWRGGMVFTVL